MKTVPVSAYPWEGYEEEIERLHDEGESFLGIERRTGVPAGYVSAYFEGIYYSEGEDAPEVYLPTTEQISEECAEIRKGWTPEERHLRMGANAPVPVFFDKVKVGAE